MATVIGVMLFGLVGVAYADSPGGWSQFNELVTKAQGRDQLAPVQQVQQPRPVYEFNTTQQRSTSLFPANPNERTQ